MEKKFFSLLILLFAGYNLIAQPVISIEYDCESAILTYEAPDDGMVYYWQGTTCGESMDDSNPSFNVTATGTYYLRAYNTTSSTWAATDCSTAIVELAQYPDEPPVPTYTSGNLVLTDPPQHVVYYAQGTSCGVLTSSPGTSWPVNTSGTYYFNAFDTVYNCWSQACSSITLVITDIDNELNNQIKITLSPIPAIDQMRISLPDNIHSIDIDIFDTMGRIVLSKKNIGSQDVIDISPLTKGSYIARFRGNNIDESQRIIISQ